MKHSSLVLAILGASLLAPPTLLRAADPAQLDVLKMQEIPAGRYDVQLQLEGNPQTVTVAIRNNRAAFVQTESDKLEGLSGQFELIGNGVFLARLRCQNHQASQWWIFHPDGTASVKEIPDRGEKQTAKPVGTR